jgi:ABC-2 type transport system ATP-binding protein
VLLAATGTVFVLVLVLAACSSSGTTPEAARPASTPTPIAHRRPTCTVPPIEPATTTPVADSASDHDLTSFDGTTIRLHWFPLPTATKDAPAPTVLMGPGWGLAGDTNVDAVGVLGALNITTLRAAGFNVLTWDPRGFGRSTGLAEVNSKDHEGKDVQRLIDWVSGQPEARLDSTGDPRFGMVGGSYGGGIQLVAAAIDCRVDAIVPVLAWHELTSSLYKAETAKLGWGDILTGISSKRVDEHIPDASRSAHATGVIDADELAFFAERGVTDLLPAIDIPTLIIQGTVDTLFTLDEGVSNYRALRDRDVPTAMVWFCGGHGTCLTEPGDPNRVSDAAIAWLTRHVTGDESVDTGPRVSVLDQDGKAMTADDYPLAAGTPLQGEGSGRLELIADGGAGPVPSSATPDMLAPLVLPITPGRATNAVNITIDPASSTAPVVGAPTVRLSYTGTAPPGERPTRVFAQLVDDATGFVLGNQITPIELTLDGQPHEATASLEMVVFTPHAGSTVTLQLVATTVAYAPPRFGGSVQFDRVHIELPTATNLSS